MKKSMRDKIAERFKRIQEDRWEKKRLENSKEYKPEQEGFLPERR